MAHDLSNAQRELVDSLARRLGEIPGVAAVVLGGSYARGFAGARLRHRPRRVLLRGGAVRRRRRARARRGVNDTPDPVVTGFYVWGPWVNGGAWLTIGGQRVDFLYRSLEHQERVIADANAGRFELHWGQQAPFGFFGPTYLGELAICRPLVDPDGRVAALKREVADYPEPLRRAIVQTYLWQAEFSLESFAPKYAARGDVLGAAGCLTRLAHQLVLVLFALNRRYLLSDKTALAEIDGFELAPPRFGDGSPRCSRAWAESPPSSPRPSRPRRGLVAETVALAGPLYRRPY